MLFRSTQGAPLATLSELQQGVVAGGAAKVETLSEAAAGQLKADLMLRKAALKIDLAAAAETNKNSRLEALAMLGDRNARMDKLQAELAAAVERETFDLAVLDVHLHGEAAFPVADALIKKGVPFRNASGFSAPEVDALVEKIKVETDPAKRKTMVVEFQKIVTREANNLPLLELETITVASSKVQNHSNDPNYLAATWYDIWVS